MPTPETKLNKFKELWKMINESLTRKEFVESFKNVVKVVLRAEKSLTDKTNGAVSDLNALFRGLEKKLESMTNAELSRVVKELKEIAEKALKEQSVSLNFIRDKVRKIKEGVDGKDGKPGIDGKVGINGSPDSPKQVRDKLEGLKGDERLDVEAIDGLQEKLDELKKFSGGQVRFGGGLSKMAMDRHILDPYTPTEVSSTEFTLKKAPNPATSLKVWLGGQKLKLTEDYTVSGKTLTLTSRKKQTGEIIEVEQRV